MSPLALRARVRETVSHKSHDYAVLQLDQRNPERNEEATMVGKSGFAAGRIRVGGREGTRGASEGTLVALCGRRSMDVRSVRGSCVRHQSDVAVA